MIQSFKILFWQCGNVDGVIARLIVALFLGVILIAAGSVCLILQAASWPFDQIRQACTRLVRELTMSRP